MGWGLWRNGCEGYIKNYINAYFKGFAWSKWIMAVGVNVAKCDLWMCILFSLLFSCFHNKARIQEPAKPWDDEYRFSIRIANWNLIYVQGFEIIIIIIIKISAANAL